MKSYLPFALLSLPFIVIFSLLNFCFDLNEEKFLFVHFLFSFFVMGVSSFLFSKRKNTNNYKLLLEGVSDSEFRLSSLLILFIMFAGVLDLIVHGLVILDSSRYDKFSSVESIIRNFSSLCWVLAPLGLLINYKKSIKFLLIGWAILFPILVVDRNRLLMALFALSLSLLFKKFKTGFSPKKIMSIILVIGGLSVSLFVAIGLLRESGPRGMNETYYAASKIPSAVICDAPKTLPVAEEIKKLPSSFQWIFLYSVTPLYNLMIQYKCSVHDSSLLKAQLIPFWKRSNSVGTPYLVAWNMNVGTEILPFFLAWGKWSIYFCLLVAFFINIYYFDSYFRTKSIFDLLIVLRLSYCSFMFGFAPQYFIYTNFAFILIMEFLKLTDKKMFRNRYISRLDYFISKFRTTESGPSVLKPHFVK